MTTKKTEVDLGALVERVRKLEAQNRRWKLASFVFLFVMAASLASSLMAQQTTEPSLMRAKKVEAQSFLLKDADGNIRAQMTMEADKPNLVVYDRTGNVIWSMLTRSRAVPTR